MRWVGKGKTACGFCQDGLVTKGPGWDPGEPYLCRDALHLSSVPAGPPPCHQSSTPQSSKGVQLCGSLLKAPLIVSATALPFNGSLCSLQPGGGGRRGLIPGPHRGNFSRVFILFHCSKAPFVAVSAGLSVILWDLPHSSWPCC